MTITIPSELVYPLSLLGYEWPELDEEEIRKAAVLTRQFGEDMSASVDRADRILIDDIPAAFKSKTGSSQADGWNENSSTNIRQAIDLIEPAGAALDVFADAVVALKLKVIAELVITAAQIAAAVASAIVTLGVGAAVQAGIIAARKVALDVATGFAVDQLIGQLMTMLIDPLTTLGEQLVQAILEAPVMAGAVGEVERLQADYAALEAAEADLADIADDQETLAEDFFTQLQSLQISTAG